MSRKILPFALVAATALTSPAWAQTVLSFKLDNTDPSYTRNAGYTYEVTSITVTNAAGFRIDGFNVSSTGVAVQRLEYALFPTDVTVPAGLRDFNQHRRHPDAVAWRRDGNPNNRGPRALNDGPNPTPLTEGEYQLVVAAQDRTGTRGDVTFSLELTGGVFGLLLSNPPPSTLDQFAAAASGNAVLASRAAQGVARAQAQSSFVSRDEALSFNRGSDADGDLLVTASTQDRPGLVGNLHLWAELSGFRAEDDSIDRDFSGYGLQIGGDVALGPNLIAGLSLGFDEISSSSGATSIDGDLVFLQPYLAYRSGAWSGEVTLIYGQGDYDQTDGGGTGTGETELWALTADLGYDIAWGANGMVTPSLALLHGREEATGVSGTLAGAGSETVDFTQVSLGARYTHQYGQGEVFAGVYADWLEMDADSTLVSNLLIEDGVSGRIEVGGRADLGGGRSLDTSFELGGLGSDVTAMNGTLRVVFNF